jgi:arylsulfatase A-like enzyme
MKSLYSAEVAYQDHMTGQLLDILKEADLFEDSWIIVMSDHGELFGEWGMVWHTASSHYQLLHVPLIVRPPGGADGRRLETPVQPVDIFVTLLEEAGVEVPALVRRAYPLPLQRDERPRRQLSVAQSHGASLVSLWTTQHTNLQSDLTHWLTWVDSVYADGYLLEMNSEGGRALFDVTEDPRMEVDQAALDPEKAQAMVNALVDWRSNRSGQIAQGTARTYATASSCDGAGLANSSRFRSTIGEVKNAGAVHQWPAPIATRDVDTKSGVPRP